MITFLSLSFWFYFALFVFAAFFAFFIPGDVFIHRYKLSPLQRTVLSLILGFTLWGFVSFILGFLNLRFLSYLYILFFGIYWIIKVYKPQKPTFSLHQDKLLLIIIFIGTLVQIISTFFNGILYKDGLYFCCGVPDSLYHIALTNELIKNVPPYEPGMSGIIVKNYHYVSNLIFADLIRVFHLPLTATLYQYSVILFSFLIGFSALVFLEIIKLQKGAIRWIIFLLYFSGDILFLLLFILGNGLDFRYGFLHDATKLWHSPPRVYAIPIFFAGLAMFHIWIKDKTLKSGLLAAMLFAILIGVKVYVGILIFTGLCCIGIWYLYKRNFLMIVPLLVALVLAAMLYLPVNANAGGLYYTGLWRFEDFIANERFGLSDWELARQVYIEHNNILRLIQYESMYAFIYLVFIFGTLLFALAQSKKSLKQLPGHIHILLIPGIIASLVVGFFFQQRTGGANTAQFIITVLFVLSIYAGISISYFSSKLPSIIKILLVTCLVVISSARVLYETGNSVNSIVNRNGFLVSNADLRVYDYLRQSTPPDSVILTSNKDNNQYLLNFLGQRPLYLSGAGILEDHGATIKEREQIRDTIFFNSDIQSVRNALKESNVDYILFSGDTKLSSTESAIFLETEYGADSLRLDKVIKDRVE